MLKQILRSLDPYSLKHNHEVHPDVRCNLGCQYRPTLFGRIFRGAR